MTKYKTWHGECLKKKLKSKKYSLIGYKGKQVRDNIHSNDLTNCFWEFYKKPRNGEIYNIGGGRYSNCSILEALNLIEKISKIKTLGLHGMSNDAWKRFSDNGYKHYDVQEAGFKYISSLSRAKGPISFSILFKGTQIESFRFSLLN